MGGSTEAAAGAYLDSGRGVSASQAAEAHRENHRADPIEAFCSSFLDKMPVLAAVPFAGAVTMIENIAGILLYRCGQFQVQMWAAPAHTIIPEHTHPNVDTVQVYVGGNILFTHLGRYVYPADGVFAMNGPLKCANKRGRIMRVRPDEGHGAIVGEGGGVFLAVQHWLNGIEPHCVSADYDGIALGQDHPTKVVFGDAVAKKRLTARDAAPLEFALDA